jgi:hypothetical protein
MRLRTTRIIIIFVYVNSTPHEGAKINARAGDRHSAQAQLRQTVSVFFPFGAMNVVIWSGEEVAKPIWHAAHTAEII